MKSELLSDVVPYEVPRKTEEELRTFVNDYLAGRLATDQNTPLKCFVPLALGTLDLPPEVKAAMPPELQKEAFELFTKDIGLIYEYRSAGGSLAFNGHQLFWSFKVLHRMDCDRVMPVINAEIERRQNLEIP